MKDGQTDDMLYWNEALGLFQRGVEPVVDLLNAANGWMNRFSYLIKKKREHILGFKLNDYNRLMIIGYTKLLLYHLTSVNKNPCKSNTKYPVQ